MTHDQAIEETKKYLHLIGKEFHLQDGETESIKAVVAWEEKNAEWYPHVCFYNWDADTADGHITHMNVLEFLEKYKLTESNQ